MQEDVERVKAQLGTVVCVVAESSKVLLAPLLCDLCMRMNYTQGLIYTWAACLIVSHSLKH